MSVLLQLVKQSEELQRELESTKDCLPFFLCSKWFDIKKKIGEALADEAFSNVAKRRDCYFLSNPVNKESYAHFSREDVQSKGFEIRSRTSRSGIKSGFFEPSDEFPEKPLSFKLRETVYFAVEREGIECLVKTIAPTDIIIKAGCYPDSSYIVSDIDLVAIVSTSTNDACILDAEYGELTKEELEILKDVNSTFQTLTASVFCRKKLSRFRPVAHGPANRFSKSKFSHIHYPLKIHSPDGSIGYLTDENNETNGKVFIEYLTSLYNGGYHTFLNPVWDVAKLTLTIDNRYAIRNCC